MHPPPLPPSLRQMLFPPLRPPMGPPPGVGAQVIHYPSQDPTRMGAVTVAAVKVIPTTTESS